MELGQIVCRWGGVLPYRLFRMDSLHLKGGDSLFCFLRPKLPCILPVCCARFAFFNAYLLLIKKKNYFQMVIGFFFSTTFARELFSKLSSIFSLWRSHATLIEFLCPCKEQPKLCQIRRTTTVKPLIWQSVEENDQLIPLSFYKEKIYLPKTTSPLKVIHYQYYSPTSFPSKNIHFIQDL